MKDGTTSSAYDESMMRKEADAKRRRNHQDIQTKMSGQRHGGNAVARLGSHRFITQDAPRLVLFYKKYNQECISEITMVPKPNSPEMEMMFTLVCPRCLERKVSQGEAQLMVRNSHRSFWVDDRPANKAPKMVNMFGMMQQVLPAGTVTVKDIVRCTNLGCGWGARITDSIVEEI